ncbi:MAG: prenyltransferase [Bacteroidaceae bacterium]|nr:prenyltransferase [Bacteroidaceae bacterium]
MKHSVKSWVLATRPWSFPASAMPVIVTMAWAWSAGYDVRWWLGLLAVVTIVFVHAAGNVWSDIADYRKGVDAPDVCCTRLLVDGIFTVHEFRRLSVLLNCIAACLGLLTVWLTGWVTLCVGIIGMLLSLCYPRLKYMALGDMVILLCYGFLPMVGTTYIVTGQVLWEVLYLTVSVGLITLAILHVNNVRDIATDRRAAILTVPMITGVRVGVWMYVFELLFPFLWLVVIAILGKVPIWALVALLALPIAISNVHTILAERNTKWEKSMMLDEKTAQLQLAFSVLLTISMVTAHCLGNSFA